MAKIIGSPTRYIQGRGELVNLAKHAGAIGDSMFILVDKFGQNYPYFYAIFVDNYS